MKVVTFYFVISYIFVSFKLSKRSPRAGRYKEEHILSEATKLCLLHIPLQQTG